MSGNGNGRQKTNGVCQLGKGHRLSSFGTSALVNTAATAVAIFCGLFKMTENFTSYIIVRVLAYMQFFRQPSSDIFSLNCGMTRSLQ